MPIKGEWERKKVLITVKTYPTPAKKGVDLSCIAGVTENGDWIRLFPIPLSFMESDQQFRRYQWIEADVAKSSDPRPESYEVNIDSLSILSKPIPTSSAWQARKNIIYPLKSHCLCCLRAAQDSPLHSTLGFIRPERIRRFMIRKDEPQWSESDQAKLAQTSMFGGAPTRLLEKIPYKFIYQVFCDEPECPGHHLSCTDWELSEAYRKWSRQDPLAWEKKLVNRFEYDMIHRFDTHLFVGTVRSHPKSWIIVGLFYPPKNSSEQMRFAI